MTGDGPRESSGPPGPGDLEAPASPEGAALRARVLRGGVPTPSQAAALGAALVTAQGSAATDPPTRLPGWKRAALLEATGARRAAELVDLDRPPGVA